MRPQDIPIYNSRNYSILLNLLFYSNVAKSTTVEIILYYLTREVLPGQSDIYNSRNYSILLNSRRSRKDSESTTVEIILYYLTRRETITWADLQQ